MDIFTCGTELKTGSDEGKYEGYFSVFENVDSGRDVAHVGMFKKTLQEAGHRVKVFYAHDFMRPIGPTPKKLLEDSQGLLAAGRLTLKSFWGREAWELMKDGALNEGSFGYDAVKFDYDEKSVRHLREVKLYEISPVPLGMNALTAVRTVKHEQQPASLQLAFDVIALALDDIKEGRAYFTADKSRLQKATGELQALLDAFLAISENEKADEPTNSGHLELLRARARRTELSLLLAQR